MFMLTSLLIVIILLVGIYIIHYKISVLYNAIHNYTHGIKLNNSYRADEFIDLKVNNDELISWAKQNKFIE